MRQVGLPRDGKQPLDEQALVGRRGTARSVVVQKGRVPRAAMGVYVAFGDRISIDDYTDVPSGGAPSPLAARREGDLVALARDGDTTRRVLADLVRAPPATIRLAAR